MGLFGRKKDSSAPLIESSPFKENPVNGKVSSSPIVTRSKGLAPAAGSVPTTDINNSINANKGKKTPTPKKRHDFVGVGPTLKPIRFFNEYMGTTAPAPIETAAADNIVSSSVPTEHLEGVLISLSPSGSKSKAVNIRRPKEQIANISRQSPSTEIISTFTEAFQFVQDPNNAVQIPENNDLMVFDSISSPPFGNADVVCGNPFVNTSCQNSSLSSLDSEVYASNPFESPIKKLRAMEDDFSMFQVIQPASAMLSTVQSNKPETIGRNVGWNAESYDNTFVPLNNNPFITNEDLNFNHSSLLNQWVSLGRPEIGRYVQNMPRDTLSSFRSAVEACSMNRLGGSCNVNSSEALGLLRALSQIVNAGNGVVFDVINFRSDVNTFAIPVKKSKGSDANLFKDLF